MKRKMIKAGSVAVIVSMLSLAGCSSTSSVKTSPSSTSSGNSLSQHETISIAFPGNGTTITAKPNDEMLKFIEKKFNISINLVTETWSNYDQQSQLWAASGQLPDVFYSDEVSNKIYDQWVNEGLVAPIPKDLSQYPNIQKLMGMQDVKSFATNGNMYFLPLLLQQSNVLPGDRGIVVRKDWMDKLHLQQPKTWDDFVNILNQFVSNNPEGKKNVVGLTSNNTNIMMNSLFMNEFPYLGWWTKENGKWNPDITSTKYADVITKLHDLYSKGLLDKEFSNPNNPAATEFVQGRAGALDQQPKNIPQLEQAWNAAHPNEKFSDYVEFLQMPPGPDGNRYQFNYLNWWSQEFINSKVDSTKMNRILSVFNYLLSPDGQILINFGIKDKDYKIVNGKIQSLHPASWNMSSAYPSQGLWNQWAAWSETQIEGVPQFQTVNPVPSGYTQESWNMYQSYIKWYMSVTKPLNINWDVNSYAQSLPAVNGSGSTWISQAAASNNPVQVWKDYMNQQLGAGLNNNIQQVNQKFGHQN